jgi:hypothetical protein
LGYSSGRIEPFAGEKLFSAHDNKLIVRIIGSDKAQVYRTDQQELELITLREPEKLALHSCGMLNANNQRKFSYDLS